MLAAGAFNLIAFFLVTKSLQMITVVRLNVLNNGLSTALTAVAGTLLLAEPWNGTLSLGMFLAIVGILMISFESHGRASGHDRITPKVRRTDFLIRPGKLDRIRKSVLRRHENQRHADPRHARHPLRDSRVRG